MCPPGRNISTAAAEVAVVVLLRVHARAHVLVVLASVEVEEAAIESPLAEVVAVIVVAWSGLAVGGLG